MPSMRGNPQSITGMALLYQHWEECRGRLLGMLKRRIDPSLAVRVDPEEVLSETFLDAVNDWPRFHAQTAITAYPWLYRLARDRLIETWRKETRGRRDLRREMSWPEASSIALGIKLMDAGTSPSEGVVRGELQSRMQQVLGGLKERDRDVLWMRHADQLPFAEIGLILDITENAATVRYVRALKRLKEMWEAANRIGDLS